MAKKKMNDGIQKRGKRSWFVSVAAGRNPITGKYKNVTATVVGKWEDAKAKRDELRKAVRENSYIAPTRSTVGDWCDEWLEKIVKPLKALNTYDSYRMLIDVVVKPTIGHILLQKLKPADLTALYGAYLKTHSARSVVTLHCVISSALKSAVKQGLVPRNVATGADGVPKPEPIERACWSEDEVSRFLAAAEKSGAQEAAFYALALDTGARRGELLGLLWEAVDLDKGKVTFRQQLLRRTPTPIYGLPKRHGRRTVDIAPGTVALLREHLAVQRRAMMKNRTTYCDAAGAVLAQTNGPALVFAKRYEDLSTRPKDRLGLPLGVDQVTRSFHALRKVAKVARITFHGLRHTNATLLLGKGVPPHIVAKRLGHRNATITLAIYAHVLDGDQQMAASCIAQALYRMS